MRGKIRVASEKNLYLMEEDTDATALLLLIIREIPTDGGFAVFHCAQCGTNRTPQIRSGYLFKGTENSYLRLCNACGLKYAKYGE